MANEPISFESMKLADPNTCVHDWGQRRERADGSLSATCQRCKVVLIRWLWSDLAPVMEADDDE